jgi:hypothetical protein
MARKSCNICNKKHLDEYVNGLTYSGWWADMCIRCYCFRGVGLGTGKGQLYLFDRDGTYKKIQG